jgi:hypothetical protein
VYRLIAIILMLEFWALGLGLIAIGGMVVGVLWMIPRGWRFIDDLACGTRLASAPSPVEESLVRAVNGLALAAKSTATFPFRGDWRSL